jgi:hypothetical protein
MIVGLDAGDQHMAFGMLEANGTFDLYGMTRREGGVQPGCYCAHIDSHIGRSQIPSKYAQRGASGIDVNSASGWSDIRIDIR